MNYYGNILRKGGEGLSFDFYKILSSNLSLESKWLLVVLTQQPEYINKEQLWELVNKLYLEKRGHNDVKPLISSRYILDLHTARLEGAGLVQVKEVGRMRIYTITELGKTLLEYIRKQN